jgi:GNAT superfamily N-acetyltransferase
VEALRSHRIDLLHLDGKLPGLIETILEVDHLLIENVAVSPAFQGRGLGRRLIARAEQLAASQGQTELRLYTNKMFTEMCNSTAGLATEWTGRRRLGAGPSCI